MKMKKRRILTIGLLALIDFIVAFTIYYGYHQNINFKFNITSTMSNQVQVLTRLEDNKQNTIDNYILAKTNAVKTIDKSISIDTDNIQINFAGNKNSQYEIYDFDIYKSNNHQDAMKNIKDKITVDNCILKEKENSIVIYSNGKNSSIKIKLDQAFIQEVIENTNEYLSIMIVAVCGIIDALLLILLVCMRKAELFKGIIANRSLIWSLSKNDFKTKYAGSFFGVLWAFVQPVITILLYWFVFQVGLRSGDQGNVPFVLWLIAGLVPWFFFQDTMLSVTNCLIEYSYLVKKMVFQIDILPIVKMISALFVHLFFISFAILVFCIMGYFPTATALQLIYYVFCTIVLVLGLGYASCALVLFFKDLNQIIQIILQIGMWMTPILWNVEMLPSQFLWIMQLNPMFYIVTGFRDSLITHTWVWERAGTTVIFWLITIALFMLGTYIYKKLKCHFADVL